MTEQHNALPPDINDLGERPSTYIHFRLFKPAS